MQSYDEGRLRSELNAAIAQGTVQGNSVEIEGEMRTRISIGDGAPEGLRSVLNRYAEQVPDEEGIFLLHGNLIS